jgi:hypothetical protein
VATRLLLTRKEAAKALGMSLSHFQRHVQPFIPCVYSGQLRLYRPFDLESWAERSARTPMEKHRRGAGSGRRRLTNAVAGGRS